MALSLTHTDTDASSITSMARAEDSDPLPKGDFQTRKWFCTVNNPKISGAYFRDQLKLMGCTKACISLEKGGENNVLHLQGAFEFPKVKRASQLLKIAPGHYEKQRMSSAAYKYCAKSLTHVEGPWVIGVPLPTEWHTGMEGVEEFDWQKQAREILDEEPDTRKIHWYWSHAGGTGKTSFAKQLHKDGALYIKLCKELHQNAAQVALHMDPSCMGVKNNEEREMPRVVVIDVVRGMDMVEGCQFLEMLKDGIIVNTKYRPCVLKFNAPHVFCFANEPPPSGSHLLGRWIIHPLE